MSAGNSIQGSFGVSLTPLQRDFAQAEQMARTSAAKVSAALNTVSSPRNATVNWNRIADERARTAQFMASGGGRRFRTAADFAPAPKGKYPSPAEQDDGLGGVTRTAFRLGGILTAVHQVARLAEAYKQAGIEAYKLGVANDDLARPQGAFAGSGAFRERLAALANLRDTTYEKRQTENQSFLSKMKAGFYVQMEQLHGYGTPAEQGAKEFQMRKEQAQRAAEAIQFMAEEQDKLNVATDTGSEREMAIAKALAEHRNRAQELADLATKAGANPTAVLNAENARFEKETASINRRANLRALEQTMHSKIGGLATGNLPPALQNIVGLQERMKFLRRKFGTGTEEENVDTGIEMGRTDTELMRARYAERNKSWEDRSAEANEQRRFQNFVAAQSPSNPNAYLSHPDAYDQRDIMGNRTSDATTSSVDQQRHDAFDRLSRGMHMTGPGQMSPFGGSEGFNKFFHKDGGGVARGSGAMAAGAAGVGVASDDSEDRWDEVIEAINNPEWAK